MKTAPLLVSAIICFHLGATPSHAQSTATNCDRAQEQLKLAEAASSQNDLTTAAERYQQAIKVAPLCVEALVNLGAVYNRLNRPEDAIAAFQQALTKNPQLFAAHLNLGITYFRSSRFDLA
ncbi:MAG TPA: tetratricopeptide repeat protein, partial [Pyrinomonadaceae bacterium]